ncbi:hypothetical protein OLMES_1381 [Oleiphilus messinensis]|uniref:DUF1501 domain-containing protein n=1 Tax=Oleiphilus messinensis TaxID=141451 RepID=A0A1Y0I4P8_9GAMM|nr:DUF1501 domain-containing protein [Oleiphilus messinensis]ARU55458.1 hypothetical protein OLMES_1381 [Oleiphilus messinensis]
MNRRRFFKTMLTATAGTMAAISGNPFSAKIKLAQAATGKTVVILFQRGGCDGLNTCIPYGDSAYYSLRPTIAVAPPSSNSASALDLDGYFGLHPGLQSLMPIWDAGDLAVMPAVHYPDGSRSHFDSQQYIESGYSSRNLDGWLNRYLQMTPGPGDMRAVSFGSDLAQALRGDVTVSSIEDLNSFDLGIPQSDSDRLLGNLSAVYDQLSTEGRASRELVKRFGSRLIHDMSALRDIDASTYVPENGAQYPSHSTGRQLQQVAQLIKSGVGLEAATVSIGGWDTHSNQGGGEATGGHYRSHTRFAESIGAFYQDLGNRMSDVILLTCTEFGRTAQENGSRGTDHGYASTWFALGGGIRGGVYGAWPGLATDQLHDGRYLEMSLDYRNVFGDILTQHMLTNNLELVLPGHTYQGVGLFA